MLNHESYTLWFDKRNWTFILTSLHTIFWAVLWSNNMGHNSVFFMFPPFICYKNNGKKNCWLKIATYTLHLGFILCLRGPFSVLWKDLAHLSFYDESFFSVLSSFDLGDQTRQGKCNHYLMVWNNFWKIIQKVWSSIFFYPVVLLVGF